MDPGCTESTRSLSVRLLKRSLTPEYTTGRDRHHLCTQCKLLDLKKFLSKPYIPFYGRELTTLPDVAIIQLKTDIGCPLCKIFQHVHPRQLRSDSRDAYVTLSSLSRNLASGNDLSMIEELEPILSSVPLTITYRLENSTFSLAQQPTITETGCILKIWNPAFISAKTRFSLFDLQIPKTDFEQLNFWLDECRESHTGSCAKHTELEHISGMQVIDVYTRGLIPATLDFNYAALSYVWGPGDQGAAQVGFPNPAPKTIEDALEVTKRLGIPYLWVDRYCIRQGREEERHDQISKMHLIYHNACITIIAAAGNGPKHGIPGIRGTPRIPQPHADLDQGFLVATFSHPTSVIKKSKWASRGWTYQEAALSRRRLAFTEYGAYFECNGFSHSEGIEEPIRRTISKSPRRLRPRLCGGISAWSSNHIWQHISDFSKRDLSFQEDRMNAILGIFNALEKSGALMGHLWGIPIPAFQPPHFLINLMWESEGPLSRNSQLPSWSWTGWIGNISPRPSLEYDLPSAHHALGLRVWVELLNGTLVRIEDYQEASGKIVENNLLSKYIHIKAATFKCRFKLQASKARTYWSPVFLNGMQERNLSSTELIVVWNTEGTNLQERLISETWDVISWSVDGDSFSFYFLVLYPFNDHVERFGHFWTYFYQTGAPESFSEDRIFRLG